MRSAANLVSRSWCAKLGWQSNLGSNPLTFFLPLESTAHEAFDQFLGAYSGVVRSKAMLGCSRLATQAWPLARIAPPVRGRLSVRQQRLDGFNAVGNEVAELEDLPHAAAPEQREDFVITYGLAAIVGQLRYGVSASGS